MIVVELVPGGVDAPEFSLSQGTADVEILQIEVSEMREEVSLIESLPSATVVPFRGDPPAVLVGQRAEGASHLEK